MHVDSISRTGSENGVTTNAYFMFQCGYTSGSHHNGRNFSATRQTSFVNVNMWIKLALLDIYAASKMTTQFTTTQIKLEGVETSENVTEIQSYLEGFQKEIAGGEGTIQTVTGKYLHLLNYILINIFVLSKVEEADGEAEEGTYFVDQQGHYYFQAKGEAEPVMTVVPGLADDDNGEEFIINPANVEDGENEQRITVVPAGADGDGTNELSYVLIVQQPEDEKGDQGEDQDMAGKNKCLKSCINILIVLYFLYSVWFWRRGGSWYRRGWRTRRWQDENRQNFS